MSAVFTGPSVTADKYCPDLNHNHGKAIQVSVAILPDAPFINAPFCCPRGSAPLTMGTCAPQWEWCTLGSQQEARHQLCNPSLDSSSSACVSEHTHSLPSHTGALSAIQELRVMYNTRPSHSKVSKISTCQMPRKAYTNIFHVDTHLCNTETPLPRGQDS